MTTRYAQTQAPVSLSQAVVLKIANSLPLPLPMPAKRVLAEQVVDAVLPQVESVLPAEKRKALKKASKADAKQVIKEAAVLLAEKIPDSVSMLATRDQQIMVIERFLNEALKDDSKVLQQRAGAAARLSVQAARAAVDGEDKKVLIDNICQSVDLDKIIGEDAERSVVENVVTPLLSQLEEVLPPESKEFLTVSSPRQFKQFKAQLVDSLLEKYKQKLGQAAGIIPPEQVRPMVESVVGNFLDALVRKGEMLDESDAFTSEERIKEALAQEASAAAEAELATERAKQLSQLAVMMRRERIELERKLYWFPPWRWFRRWQRAKAE